MNRQQTFILNFINLFSLIVIVSGGVEVSLSNGWIVTNQNQSKQKKKLNQNQNTYFNSN